MWSAKITLSLCFLFLAFGFVARVTAAQNARSDKEMKRVASWMTGSFDTFAQVEADEASDATYKHIRALVHVTPVSIAGMENGLAFYIENQASGDRPRPYRQRVYFMKRGADNKIVVEMYKIKDDKDFINAYQKTELLRKLTFERLIREDGCNMSFVKAGEDFFKGTAGENKICKSSLRGSTYMMSHTDLSPTKWINLDQGFDDAGNSKWGPPPGTVGHIFIRRKTEN